MATTHYSEQPLNGPAALQRSYLILWKPSYHVTYVGETEASLYFEPIASFNSGKKR